MHWMNDHTPTAVALLLAVGYSLHMLYEILGALHDGKHITGSLLAFMALRALIVFLGAGIAGWAVDLVFTKGEEEAGEID